MVINFCTSSTFTDQIGKRPTSNFQYFQVICKMLSSILFDFQCKYSNYRSETEENSFLRHIQSTVVPGFKVLGPSTALSAVNPGSALNPGTFSLRYREIVFKHKIDLNNTIYFFSKNSKELEKNLNKFSTKAKIITKIAVFSVFSCKNH